MLFCLKYEHALNLLSLCSFSHETFLNCLENFFRTLESEIMLLTVQSPFHSSISSTSGLQALMRAFHVKVLLRILEEDMPPINLSDSTKAILDKIILMCDSGGNTPSGDRTRNTKKTRLEKKALQNLGAPREGERSEPNCCWH